MTSEAEMIEGDLDKTAGEVPAGDEPAVLNLPLDEAVRITEALLFSSDEPVSKAVLKDHVGSVIDDVIEHLQERYLTGGIVFTEVASGFALRTAPDLAYLFEEKAAEPRKLSRAALETLAIIAYHQPVTRAEIEDIRGVVASKGTLDVLLETGWVRMRGRRRTPGRPVTYGTTPIFLDQFSLATIGDLPGLDELKGAGLLEAIPPGAIAAMPSSDDGSLTPDEDPLDEDDRDGELSAMALWPEQEAEAGQDESDDQNSGRDQ